MDPATKPRIELTQEELKVIKQLRKLKESLHVFEGLIEKAPPSLSEFVVQNYSELYTLRSIRKKKLLADCESVAKLAGEEPPKYATK